MHLGVATQQFAGFCSTMADRDGDERKEHALDEKLSGACDERTVEAKLYFSGTGTSSGVPVISCLVQDPVVCDTCRRARYDADSPDKRGNTGAIIQFTNEHARPVTIAIGTTSLAARTAELLLTLSNQILGSIGGLPRLSSSR